MQSWEHGVADVGPFGMFGAVWGERHRPVSSAYLVSRLGFRPLAARQPPSAAALAEARRRAQEEEASAPTGYDERVNEQIDFYEARGHPHIPRQLLSSLLREEAAQEAQLRQYDALAGTKLACCSEGGVGFACLESTPECVSTCRLDRGRPDAGAWSEGAIVESAVHQVLSGAARVHGATLVGARTTYSVHVLRALDADGGGDDASGAVRLLPACSVRTPAYAADAAFSPHAAGELALATSDGRVRTLLLDRGRGGGAGVEETACVPVRRAGGPCGSRAQPTSWHAVAYGTHPRQLWHADSLEVRRIDTRAPPLGSCTALALARGAAGGAGGATCMDLGLPASEPILAIAAASDHAGPAADACAPPPQLAVASARQLLVLDARFLRRPLLSWRSFVPPLGVEEGEQSAPAAAPLLRFCTEPAAVLRVDVRAADATWHPVWARSAHAPGPAPLARSVLDGASALGSWQCVNRPLTGLCLGAPERGAPPAGAPRRTMWALDSNGALWAVDLLPAEDGATADAAETGAAPRAQDAPPAQPSHPPAPGPARKPHDMSGWDHRREFLASRRRATALSHLAARAHAAEQAEAREGRGSAGAQRATQNGGAAAAAAEAGAVAERGVALDGAWLAQLRREWSSGEAEARPPPGSRSTPHDSSHQRADASGRRPITPGGDQHQGLACKQPWLSFPHAACASGTPPPGPRGQGATPMLAGSGARHALPRPAAVAAGGSGTPGAPQTRTPARPMGLSSAPGPRSGGDGGRVHAHAAQQVARASANGSAQRAQHRTPGTHKRPRTSDAMMTPFGSNDPTTRKHGS